MSLTMVAVEVVGVVSDPAFDADSAILETVDMSFGTSPVLVKDNGSLGEEGSSFLL